MTQKGAARRRVERVVVLVLDDSWPIPGLGLFQYTIVILIFFDATKTFVNRHVCRNKLRRNSKGKRRLVAKAISSSFQRRPWRSNFLKSVVPTLAFDRYSISSISRRTRKSKRTDPYRFPSSVDEVGIVGRRMKRQLFTLSPYNDDIVANLNLWIVLRYAIKLDNFHRVRFQRSSRIT